MAAYERVLSDALEGDADAVCADGLRRRSVAHRRSGADDECTPVREYEPGSWGPTDRAEDIAPPGGWANPLTGEGPSSYD